MLASDLIALARGAELKTLSQPAYPDETVLGYINLGLVELYKRFSIATGEAMVTLSDGKTVYTLDNAEADIDMPGGSLLSIEAVYNEVGTEYTLNNEKDANSVFQISWNQIQVPNAVTGGYLSVIYKESAVFLTAVTESVKVPDSLIEALLHFIGYRAHGAIDGNIQAENNTHYQRFEASCTNVRNLGLITADDVMYKKTTQERGYV